MSDTTTTPATGETQLPKKTRTRGPINAKYLDEITLVGKLVPVARLAENVALLTARGCTPADVTALEKSAHDLNQAALLAVGRTASRKLDTQEEHTARTRLLAAIHPIRTGAKRSHRGNGHEAGRDAYFVNEPTDVSLERLLFIAGSILLKLTPQPNPSGTGTLPAEETLKGVTPENLAELAAARDAYIDKDATTTATGHQAAAHRQNAEALFAQTRAHRIDLQLAADQAWPHTNPANAATRHAFLIPENRPAHE
jgi:hypothetical protein